MSREHKEKACIVYISSRQRCLKKSLNSVWQNFNYKYDYPVYVHYFDDIYDDEQKRREITGENKQKVFWKEVPYNTPKHIDEKELFYNRKDLWYVRNSFPPSRKGYLHMSHFTSNMYGYPNTELEKYEFIMTHDDEAGFLKELSFDPVGVMKSRNEMIGAFSYKRHGFRNEKPHQGGLDTTVNLWNFTKSFLEKNSVTPVLPEMKNLLKSDKAEYESRFIKVPDTYVINTKMYELDSWKKWISSVNEYGGNYKFRWGDCVVLGFYHAIYHGDVYDFTNEGNPIINGLYNQSLFRNIQDIAPGVKDLTR